MNVDVHGRYVLMFPDHFKGSNIAYVVIIEGPGGVIPDLDMQYL